MRKRAWKYLTARSSVPYGWYVLAGLTGLGVGAGLGALASWDPWTTAVLIAFATQAGFEFWWRRRHPVTSEPEQPRVPGDPRYRM
jgi:hypothetical protein